MKKWIKVNTVNCKYNYVVHQMLVLWVLGIRLHNVSTHYTHNEANTIQSYYWIHISSFPQWIIDNTHLALEGEVQGIFNTLRLRQDGWHSADHIFKYIFLNGDVWILINISQKFVPKGPIINIPALVQITAWHWPGNKPLSEPMIIRLSTHSCVTQPQWNVGPMLYFVQSFAVESWIFFFS